MRMGLIYHILRNLLADASYFLTFKLPIILHYFHVIGAEEKNIGKSLR